MSAHGNQDTAIKTSSTGAGSKALTNNSQPEAETVSLSPEGGFNWIEAGTYSGVYVGYEFHPKVKVRGSLTEPRIYLNFDVSGDAIGTVRLKRAYGVNLRTTRAGNESWMPKMGMGASYIDDLERLFPELKPMRRKKVLVSLFDPENTFGKHQSPFVVEVGDVVKKRTGELYSVITKIVNK